MSDPRVSRQARRTRFSVRFCYVKRSMGDLCPRRFLSVGSENTQSSCFSLRAQTWLKTKLATILRNRIPRCPLLSTVSGGNRLTGKVECCTKAAL